MFPRDMVCLRNISVDTLHKGDTKDNNNNNNNNNNNTRYYVPIRSTISVEGDAGTYSWKIPYVYVDRMSITVFKKSLSLVKIYRNI